MGQTRRERENSDLQVSQAVRLFEWSESKLTQAFRQLDFPLSPPTSLKCPHPTPKELNECTCPSSTALASNEARIFSFRSCLQIWASCWGLCTCCWKVAAPAEKAEQTLSLKGDKRTDWRSDRAILWNLHKISLPCTCFWGTTMGDGGSLGLFHKSQRQALSDTPCKRKALVRFLSWTAVYST